jgi:predicted permease
MNELRLALRRLIKRPGASVASVLTLAFGIAGASSAWSLLSAVLIEPLPVPDSDRIVVVGARTADEREVRTAFVYPTVDAVRSSGVFDEVAAGGTWSVLVTLQGEGRTRGMYFVSANLFTFLGVRMQLGRDFSAADDQRGAPPVAILSDRFWRTALGADPSVIGQTIRIGDTPVQVVGVAARGFPGVDLSRAPDLYGTINTASRVISGAMNLYADTGRRTSPTAWITIFGRLRPGVPQATVSERLTTMSFGEAGRVAHLIPIQEAALPEVSRPAMAQFTRLLSSTVGLLLLAGCLTVGLLLLVRTEARRDEFAMCLALGASRGRLARGIAVEGALLAGAGAALSLPMTAWFLSAVRAFQLPGGVSVDALDLALDRGVIISAAAAAAIVALVIASVGGLFGFSAQLSDVVRARSGATARLTRRRLRAALVVGQVAVTLALVCGAGLFLRSLAAALRVNPGFETAHLVTGSVRLRRYVLTPAQATPFFTELRDRLAASPAIGAASLTSTLVGMSGGSAVVVDGVSREFPSVIWMTGVDERYFSTVGLPILRGRDFTGLDDGRAAPVTIVSQSLARLLVRDDGGDPLGRRIMSFRGGGPGQPWPTLEVVGVVPDVVTDVTRLQPLVMYLPRAQHGPSASYTLLFRPAADIEAAVRDAVTVIRSIDPELAPDPVISPLITMDQQIAEQMGPQRFGLLVLGALGGVALMLMALGSYVMAASMAAVRMREMGVRAALGARGRELASIVLGESVRLVGLGVAVGLALVWVGTDTVRAFLFRVEPLDPVTLATAAAIIVAVALAVTARPAIVASRVDLAGVLREE